VTSVAEPTDPRVHVEVLGRLDADEVAAVTALVERATESDGVRPLSEHVTLHLRYGGDDRARNVLVYVDDEGHERLAGYAHLDVTDAVQGPSAEMVVDPAWRERGLGRRLLAQLLGDSPDGRLRLWAHGEHSAAGQLARSMGFDTTRRLWQMRRSLYAPIPDPRWAPGIHVRTFAPGRDDEAWVALNARAFAGHPEQGEWTVDDLRRRMDEPWFDPEGFFLAERTDGGEGGGALELVGFHWTKVHGGARSAHEPDGPHTHDDHAHDPIGEVYVVGVDPSEQGKGLGVALTLVGLRYMRAKGLGEVMLYVDADNAPAIHVYQRLGFTRWDTDVMYRHRAG
jgi:mycothiol synthase